MVRVLHLRAGRDRLLRQSPGPPGSRAIASIALHESDQRSGNEDSDPKLTLVCSVGDGRSCDSPRTVTQELIREARQPTTSTGSPRSDDLDPNVFHTSDVDSNGVELCTIAVVLRPSGHRTVWRFEDGPDDRIDFAVGRRLV